MMEKKRILEEGLLEKYIMDELSNEERLSVEQAIENDAALKKQFQLMEADFEKMAFENAISPGPRIKTSLQKQLKKQKGHVRYRNFFAIAAGLALLFMLSTFYLYNKWKSAETDFNRIQNRTSSLEERLESLEKNYQLTNAQFQFVNDGETVPLLLKGNEKAPAFNVVAYINHQDQKVMVNAKNLPELADDQTYQLWSDVDGEMISMGLLKNTDRMVAMDYIDRAESLNVTIEPAGGNDHATVENLVSNVFL